MGGIPSKRTLSKGYWEWWTCKEVYMCDFNEALTLILWLLCVLLKQLDETWQKNNDKSIKSKHWKPSKNVRFYYIDGSSFNLL